MKLMPDASVSKATFDGYFSDVKGKRKATDDPEDDKQNKRFAGDDDDDEDGEVGGSASSGEMNCG